MVSKIEVLLTQILMEKSHKWKTSNVDLNQATFSTKPVLAERPDVECVPFSVMPSSVSWAGVPVNDFLSGSNFSQLGNGDPSAKEALKLTPAAPDVTPSGTWNPNGLATSAFWSGTIPRARGFKDSPIPDASEETPPPPSFPEALVIPGFPSKPKLVPVPAPEIVDVATPQLSTSAWKHICVWQPLLIQNGYLFLSFNARIYIHLTCINTEFLWMLPLEHDLLIRVLSSVYVLKVNIN